MQRGAPWFSPRDARLTSTVAAICVLVLVWSGVLRLDGQADLERAEEARSALDARLHGLAHRLEAGLEARARLAARLQVGVAANPDLAQDDFGALAAGLLSLHPRSGVRALLLARGAVVSHLYPRGHGPLPLGHDLAADPRHADAVRAVLDTGEIVAGAPRETADGTRTLLLLSAVELPASAPPAPRSCWGLAIVAVELEVLLREAGIDRLDCSLRAADGPGGPRDPGPVVHGRPATFDDPHATAAVDVPGGRWTLAAPLPPDAAASRGLTALHVGGGLLAIVLAVLAGVVVGRPARLRRNVERAASDLAASRRRLHTFMESSPLGVYEADADGRVTFVNTRFSAITHVGREDALGDGWMRGVHPDDRAGVERSWSRVVREGGEFSRQFRFVRPDGVVVWVAGSAAPVRDDRGGRLLGFTGAILDVSERVRVEKEHRDLEARVLHAQKLESLGVLAGGIAHDFNNLLMGALGQADIALRSLPADSPVRANITEVVVAAQRASELCHQMLAYAGRGTFALESVDLNAAVREMAGLVEATTSRNVDLAFELGEDLPPVDADVTQLRQVLTNLVINASEAMAGREGRVRVRTGARELSPADLRALAPQRGLSPGRYACLVVDDDGCGMDATTRARIFEPFFTTKFPGRGLGLSAVLGIVGRHRGLLDVRSEPGVGTVCTVWFPAGRTGVVRRDEPVPVPAPTPTAVPSPPAAGSGALASPAAPGERGAVLLVDDELVVREVGREMLEVLGYEPIVAPDADAAVAALRERGDAIRAVILDLTMPRVDGIECLNRLRRIDEDVRIVVSSGYGEEDAMARFPAGSVASFLQKPYRVEELRHCLEAALASAERRRPHLARR